MDNFLRYGVPVIILTVAIIVAYLIPASQPTQIIIAALLGGIPMLMLNNLLHKPNVIIDELDPKVHYHTHDNNLHAWVSGMLKNKSLAGSGELANLQLRIFLDGEKYINIPPEYGHPDIIGFRFQPNGVFPTRTLYFEYRQFPSDINIEEKTARILLDVVGQKRKTYDVKMLKEE